jgi:catechol 2,3-dioxygenase-like lactoylglutathione lyase family enzyme
MTESAAIVTGIDHAMILVRDLDRAAATFDRLGFTLTERGRHTRLGTANHCIMLGRDYLELLTVVEPTPENAPRAAALADREGPYAAALATDDAVAAAAALAARGLKVGAPVRFSRPVALADGTHDAKFVVTHIDASETPGASMFFCQHLTRDLVWRPEWQRHANGATGIAGVLAVAPDPAAVAARYRRLVGEGRVAIVPGRATVAFGDCAMTIVPEAAAAALSAGVAPAPAAAPVRLVGFTLRTADLAGAAALLARAGIAHTAAPGMVVVHPAAAHGAVLSFVPAAG